MTKKDFIFLLTKMELMFKAAEGVIKIDQYTEYDIARELINTIEQSNLKKRQPFKPRIIKATDAD